MRKWLVALCAAAVALGVHLWGRGALGPEPLYHGIHVQRPGSASGGLPELYRRLLLAADTTGSSASGGGGELVATRAIKLPDQEYPEWAAIGEPQPSWQRSRNESVAAVAALNANASRRADVLVYGDSLTVMMGRNKGAWASFRDSGLDALPLGMTGSTVEQLAWRVLEGGERPALPPRAAVFFIGVNNLVHEVPGLVGHLDWLLQWAQAAWPETRIALMKLLPSGKVDVEPTNAAYNEVAAQLDLPLIECGQDWDPTDLALFNKDELHHSPQGQQELAACIAAAVAPLVANATELVAA